VCWTVIHSLKDEKTNVKILLLFNMLEYDIYNICGSHGIIHEDCCWMWHCVVWYRHSASNWCFMKLLPKFLNIFETQAFTDDQKICDVILCGTVFLTPQLAGCVLLLVYVTVNQPSWLGINFTVDVADNFAGKYWYIYRTRPISFSARSALALAFCKLSTQCHWHSAVK